MAELKLSILRDRKNFHGAGLIIGCGHDHKHYFKYGCNGFIHSEDLHPAKDFYIINAEINEGEGKPDFLSNFSDRLSESAVCYLGENYYNFICFERTTGLFEDSIDVRQVLDNVHRLISSKGICLFFGCGRDLEEKTLEHFQEAFAKTKLYTYGVYQAWSLLGYMDLETTEPFPSLKTYLETTMQKIDNPTITEHINPTFARYESYMSLSDF